MPTYSLSTQPTQLAHLDAEQELTIRVLGAGTVLLAQSLSDSQNSVGVSYVATDNVQKQKWNDELWATCDDPLTKVQIVFPNQGNSPNAYVYVPESKNNIVRLLIAGASKQGPQRLCCKTLSLKSAFSKLIGRNVYKCIPFLLLIPFLHSQNDVIIPPQSSPFITISKGLTWGVKGIGGIENNYIITFNTAPSDICFQVVNNSATTHVFSVGVFGTQDLKLSQYSSTSGRWVSLPTSQSFVSIGSTTPYIVGATSSFYVHVYAQGFPRVSFNISATILNGADSADIYADSACGSIQGQNEKLPAVPVFCSLSSPFSALASTTTVAIAQPFNIKSTIYVCSLSVYACSTGNPTDIAFTTNSAAACNGVSNPLWNSNTANNSSSFLFKTFSGQTLCATNNSTTNACGAVSYSVFP